MTVTVVEPGFTRTEFQDRAGLTENAGMPDFVWQTAEAVADATLDGRPERARPSSCPAPTTASPPACPPWCPGTCAAAPSG